jgi:hypothetical protein
VEQTTASPQALGGKMQSKQERQAASYEELAYSNMLQLQALIELLSEKGLVGQSEVLERVKKIQHEIRDGRPN